MELFHWDQLAYAFPLDVCRLITVVSAWMVYTSTFVFVKWVGSNFWPLFSRPLPSTPHISETKRPAPNKNASVNLQCVPLKVTYFPWPLTPKRLRSVCSVWPTLRRPLRCNHRRCDMSSLFQVNLFPFVFYLQSFQKKTIRDAMQFLHPVEQCPSNMTSKQIWCLFV